MRRIFLLIVIVLLAYVAYEWVTFPSVEELKSGFPKTTAFMDIRRAELRSEGKDDTLQYTPVAYGRISPYLRRGVLVAEDNSFYEHSGVDTKAMQEAFERDWKRKQITHGGSTITQQLAKNLYLSPSRNPLRKVREYFLAMALERHLTKKRILELYLNVVEMGERVYGAEAAARFYFHKPASSLTPREAALLAGCLPNPQMMVASSPNKRLRARQRMILSRLRRWGYLAESEVLTEKKPAAPPVTDTALQQTPPSDTASPATTVTTATTETTDTAVTTNSDTTSTVPPPEVH
ncbi:MAG TPA: monofunctional biosynthetic peptidoglycan transglycosylase [Thermoanaerobaculia bacterium]|jgi:monofunctional biosynthetic peptidoglycan transglycosylase